MLRSSVYLFIMSWKGLSGVCKKQVVFLPVRVKKSGSLQELAFCRILPAIFRIFKSKAHGFNISFIAFDTRLMS